jgi:hypothetical protein
MKKNKAATDEGIKMGPIDSVSLERADDNSAPANKAGGTHRDDLTGEKDADDMVHEPHNEFPGDSVEQDFDEVVHEQTGGITTAKEAEDHLTEEEDMDELVHRNGGKR